VRPEVTTMKRLADRLQDVYRSIESRAVKTRMMRELIKIAKQYEKDKELM
jgi:uncharacterized protein (UPF0335 family)